MCAHPALSHRRPRPASLSLSESWAPAPCAESPAAAVSQPTTVSMATMLPATSASAVLALAPAPSPKLPVRRSRALRSRAARSMAASKYSVCGCVVSRALNTSVAAPGASADPAPAAWAAAARVGDWLSCCLANACRAWNRHRTELGSSQPSIDKLCTSQRGDRCVESQSLRCTTRKQGNNEPVHRFMRFGTGRGGLAHVLAAHTLLSPMTGMAGERSGATGEQGNSLGTVTSLRTFATLSVACSNRQDDKRRGTSWAWAPGVAGNRKRHGNGQRVGIAPHPGVGDVVGCSSERVSPPTLQFSKKS